MRSPKSLLADLARAHAGDLPDLDARILERLRETVPEFFVDPDVATDMTAAVAANVRRVHRLLHTGGERALAAGLPADAGDLLQTTIQHGIPLLSLLEAYRAAQGVATDWWQRRLERVTPPGLLAPATSALLRIIVAYIDAAAVQIRESYETERREHEGSVEGRRAHLIRRLLAGEPVDTDAAGRTLNHPLDGQHVGLVLTGTGGVDLGRELARIAEIMSAARILTLPARHRTYAWLSTRGAADLTPLRQFVPSTGVTIAASTMQPGVGGFVQAHREAVRTAQVARTSRGPHAVSFFEQFELAALLSRDPGDCDRFVLRVLGSLAADTRAAARSRQTLRVYLEEASSPTRAAARLGLHRNTVAYRMKIIGEALQDIEGRGLELQLALHLVDQLGPMPTQHG
jgi:hypothetical protein